MGSDPRFSEEEARQLWRRAAELHAAAERTRSTGGELVRRESGDLTFADVTAAAEGAGIEPDYVRLAVAERTLPDSEEIRRDRPVVRWARRVVAERDAIELSRLIRATPERVLDVLHGVATRPPFNLHVENRLGTDPTRDGVLVYRISDMAGAFGGPLNMADARVLLFTIRAEGDAARLRARVPLFRRGVNLVVSGTSAGLLGAGGSWAGVSAGGALAALLGTASLAVLAVPAGLGAIAGGALGIAGYRRLYHSLLRSAENSVHSLLAAVAMDAEAAPPPAGSSPAAG